MAFKEIAGKKNYRKYADCEEGDVLVEGVFLRQVQGRYGVQYEFESDNGSIEVLNSAGLLNHKMQYIREGDRVKIIYDGSEILERPPIFPSLWRIYWTGCCGESGPTRRSRA